MNIPKRPDNVSPVGPKLESPVKSALSGPRVVRIEAPEHLPTPRPRSAPGATGGTGGPPRTGRVGGTGTGGRGDDRRGRRDDTGRSGRLARADRTGAAPGEPWRAQDLAEREDRLNRAGGFFKTHRRETNRAGGANRPGEGEAAGPVHISEPITIKELSAATGVKAADILKKLFLMGSPSTINSAIDREKAIEIMMDFDIEIVVEQSKSAAEIIEERFADREKIDERPRAPVVTILGHVDHGKTSLLDKIRNANVAAGEAGGITQKTSAFTVPVKAGDYLTKGDRVVTFIDTPGHEAFTNMRARGAKVTDIAVLVIAADDGCMPQTIESIAHAKAAGVPIVVALNKIDKPEATDSNIQRILGQLAGQELNPVEWGGQVEVVKTSATKGTGIQELLEILDYQADLLGLTAAYGGEARGTVLEAKMEEGRGPVASVIVQEGTIKKGDFIVVGRGFGRVRDLVNDRGQRITEAGPSTPIAISGIDLLPDAGDKFFVVPSIKAAEEAAEERRRLDRERELAAPRVTLDTFFASLEKGKKKELALVVKADSQGSVEALRSELSKIGTDEIQVVVKHCAVGGITENDVALAEATKAFIVGFNVTSSTKARSVSEAKQIEIRLYDVIYDLKDDVTKAASGLLAPELKLEVLGHADVRQAFKISKVGMIAGCYVTDGTIERNAQIRVTRGGIVIEKDRRLEQLKRFKDDAKEVRAGQECGMKIVGYDDIKVGDVLECYKTVQVARSL
jgi:translation initiation factor IF-2